MSRTITLTLDSNLDELDRIASLTDQIVAETGCGEEDEHRIMLVLSELATNAIKHGNRGDPGKKVRIRVSFEPGRITVNVRDEGEGFDPKTLPDPRSADNLMKTGGRGVWLVKEYSDHVHYYDHGKSVEVQFNI